jgi:hypothetical protein
MDVRGADIPSDTGKLLATVIEMEFEFTGLVLAQGALDTIVQLTMSPLAREVEE